MANGKSANGKSANGKSANGKSANGKSANGKSAIVSLRVFSINLKVDWGVGIVRGAGNMRGAWLATRFAANKGAVWVRRFVIVVILLSAAQLLGVFE